MATITKFEDISAWEKSRELSKEIYSIINKNKDFNNNQALTWHIMKTAGSIMDNIAEGYERGGNKEFIQFLAIAKGSSAELRSQLYRAFDLELISESELSGLNISATDISKMINGLIKYLKSSDKKGYKFK
jgi:four helix bundle protein